MRCHKALDLASWEMRSRCCGYRVATVLACVALLHELEVELAHSLPNPLGWNALNREYVRRLKDFIDAIQYIGPWTLTLNYEKCMQQYGHLIFQFCIFVISLKASKVQKVSSADAVLHALHMHDFTENATRSVWFHLIRSTLLL